MFVMDDGRGTSRGCTDELFRTLDAEITTMVRVLFVGLLLGSITSLAAAADLPARALASFGRSPFHPGSRIHAAEMSPDGKLLATLAYRSATVWDAATGQPVHRFFFDIPAHPSYQRGLAFSPDSKRLACGPSSELIVVWDLATGKELRRLATPFEMFGFSLLRFAADGAALIVQSNDDVIWFDAQTGAERRRLKGIRLKEVSPDDKTLVIVHEGQRELQIGDAVTGKIVHTLPIAAMRDTRARGVLFLPDRSTLAVVHHFDYSRKEIQFWNIQTGKRLAKTIPLPTSEGLGTYRLALSPDAKVIYFPHAIGNIRRYSLETTKELAALPDWTTAVFTAPDGKTLFQVGMDDIRRWDLTTDKQISRDDDFIDWRESAISEDGRWLALRGYQHALELCDTDAGTSQRIAYPWNNGATLAFAPNHEALAINVYGHLDLLDIPKLTLLRKFTPAGDHLGEATIQFSPDGRLLASRSSTRRLRVFDRATAKEILAVQEARQSIFTPDGKKLWTEEDKLRRYDLATRKVEFEVERPKDRGNNRRRGAWITVLAFSPDHRTLALAMSGGHVVLLDAATGAERGRLLAVPTFNPFGLVDDHYLHPTALTFSPDGQWLAVGGDDGYLRIWEVRTRRELYRLHGHEGPTQTLAFAAQGRRLVSFGDNEGFVWDLRPARDARTFAQKFEDLRGDDGPALYRAMWSLIDEPGSATKLRELLPHKRVDARPERIARLVVDLDAEEFKVRDQATRALAEVEFNARPALLSALAGKASLETERRIRKLLTDLDTDTGPNLRISRAVRAVELNGGDAARQLLQEWSDGTAGLRLTDEARAALARLGAHVKR